MARPDDARPRVVLVTHPPDGAEAFAHALVESRVAACVNLLPARSVYRWEGAVEASDETLLVVKTTSGALPALEDVLRERHPYDVPECVALEPAAVEPAYLAWLLGALTDGDGTRA